MFKLLAQDAANHEVYGARIGAVLAVFVILLVATIAYQFADHAPLLGAVAALGGAGAAGKLKEHLDARANAKTAAENLKRIEAGLPELPMPHSVEQADIVSTTIGGAMVAAPLVAIWLFV